MMEESERTKPETEPAPLLAIMGRFYPFDESGIPFADTTLVIQEMQNQSNVGGEDGGTGLNVWDGALLIARYLEKRPEIVRNKKVLELGSGCGLVGIASGILGANEVVMTDLQYALPLMRENVERNESSWKGEEFPCQRIECEECDWFVPPPINELFGSKNEGMRPDVVLVADCVWISSLIAPLLHTLKMYTTDGSTKVIITYQQRGREAHEEFWQGIQELFDVVVVDTEKSAGLTKPDVFHVFECTKKK
mmetsp:Transcript_558/g.1033  ORF Transcript_558/g.1033 Transcript_558/m.1033 type:complete len:250 (-) Transcript_558:90-839(-)